MVLKIKKPRKNLENLEKNLEKPRKILFKKLNYIIIIYNGIVSLRML